jgi:hypothetical protein
MKAIVMAKNTLLAPEGSTAQCCQPEATWKWKMKGDTSLGMQRAAWVV